MFPVPIWIEISQHLDFRSLVSLRRTAKIFSFLSDKISHRKEREIIKIQRFWRNYKFGERCRYSIKQGIISCNLDTSRDIVDELLEEIFKVSIYNSRYQHILLQQGKFKSPRTKCEGGYHICSLCFTQKLPCKYIEYNYCEAKKYCSGCVTKSKKFFRKIIRRRKNIDRMYLVIT